MFCGRYSTKLKAKLNSLFSRNICSLRLVLIQSTQVFSGGSLNLQDSCYWRSIFSSLQPLPWKVTKFLFFCFLIKLWNKFLQHSYTAYQSKLYLNKYHIIYLSGCDLFTLSNFWTFWPNELLQRTLLSDIICVS